MSRIPFPFSHQLKAVLALSATLFLAPSYLLAEVSDKPLAVSSGAASNLMFILDDSASMQREYLPGGIRRNLFDEFYYSSLVNTLWYNPDTEYRPPLKTNGVDRMDDASYTSAWYDGYEKGRTVDLSDGLPHRRYRPINYYLRQYGASDVPRGGGFFSYLDTQGAGCNPSRNILDDDCWQVVSINDASDDQKQNFANWFSYYRTRQFAARARISESFKQVDKPTRVGWSSIDTAGTLIQKVKAFDDAHKKAFRKWLYEADAPGNYTPLRQALNDVGQYYEDGSDEGPWSDTPGELGDPRPQATCRQSFAMMMTDGAYNAAAPQNLEDINVDGSDGPTIDNPEGGDERYQSQAPFADNVEGTLGDVAMHYWKRDLRPDLENRVPPSGDHPGYERPLDPAFWQHMVTMGVTLGVSGNINPDNAFDSIFEGSSVNWPNPPQSEADRIDDLLHAAVNSRGAFIDAADPESFQEGVSQLLTSVNERSELSASAAAASSAVLNADSSRFVAGFRSSDWSGTLVSERFRGEKQNWSASEQLLDQVSDGSRKLVTTSQGGGVALTLENLSQSQRQALNTDPEGGTDSQAQKRIDWLYGEAVDGLRDRTGINKRRLLGDVVNSDPQIERKQNFGFGQLGTGYQAYRRSEAYQQREDALYLGANDGMLHAFAADDGEELFAYMPSEVFEPQTNGAAGINELMDPGYDHRFYVDGTPTVMDARLDSNWTTVVVGTMGVGGRTVFALDVSEPSDFDPSDDVLWEFQDDDLARGVEGAQVGKLASGEWVAVFGNGHDADEGYLYVVNLENGDLIAKVDGGSAGLSTPVFTVDDGLIEYAYAGNTSGELMRFDLTDTNHSKWDSETLFEAEGPDGNAQPITSKPVVANLPRTRNQRVITFGTGQFYERGDQNDDSVQSLYGIIDEGGSSKNIQRRDLLRQQILEDDTKNIDVQSDDGDSSDAVSFTLREVSQKALSDKDQGWVLDLDTVSGERVVSQPTFPSGIDRSRVRFSTLIPASSACAAGTDGFLMEISLISGGRVNEPVFDLNNDGEGDNKDVSGIKSVLGGEKLTTIRDGGIDRVVDPQERDVNLLPPEMSAGRQYWRELRR